MHLLRRKIVEPLQPKTYKIVEPPPPQKKKGKRGEKVSRRLDANMGAAHQQKQRDYG